MSLFVSVKTKLLALILGGILITIALLTASTLFIDHYITQHLEKRADLNLSGISQLIEDYKTQAMAQSLILSVHPEIIKGVKAGDHKAILNFSLPQMNNGKLDYITITDKAGNVLARAHNPEEAPKDNIAYQANIRSALGGTPFVCIEEGTQVKLSIRAGSPIRDENGAIIGALSTGYVISNNKILDHAQKLFGNDFSLLQNGKPVGSTLEQSFSALWEDPLSIQAVQEQGKIVINHGTIQGNPYVTGYAPLSGPDGKIIAIVTTAVPLSLITDLISAILNNIFLSSSVVLLLAGLLGYLFARRFVKSITDLRDMMTRVGQGDYSLRGQVASHDEIGQLTLAFNEMIQKQADALEKHNQLDEAILKSERKLKEITSAVGEGILVLDADGLLTFMNPEGERLLGWTEEELLGKNIHDYIHGNTKHPRPTKRDKCLILQSIRTGQVQRCTDDIFLCKDGVSLPVSYIATPLTSNGQIVGSVTAFQDITDRKQLDEALKFQAFYDNLTSLPNRTFFQITVQEALESAQETGVLLAVMFIDLNRLKWINDTLGHAVGDIVLDRVAQRIAGIVGLKDTLGRFGGDEFTILMPRITGEEDVITMANKVVKILSEPLSLEGHEIFLSASIGACIAPTYGDTMENLLKNADLALLQAKEQGRNSFKLYTPDMDRITSEQLLMENHLRKAIDLGELELHYQPQIDSRTNEIIGMEALLRWNHTQWGLISPVKFIPVAEDSGMIIPITEWVLYQACAQNKAWQDQGMPKVPVGVNISASHFQQKELVDLVSRVLQETGLEAKYLDLEITETISVYDFDSVVSTLHQLDLLGVEISIDDFGTGYSSLNYLRQFPIDTLKIDKSFIRDIEDTGDGTIAEAIIAMARTLNLKVTAEGVETESQKEFLEGLECDKLQGFLFSKPLNVQDMSRFLQEQTNTATN